MLEEYKDMLFVTIQNFLSDLKTIISDRDEGIHGPHTTDDPNIVSLGTSKADKRQATVRIIAQLSLTLFVIGLCLYVVINTAPNDTGNKLAYAGFGIVFGYWFR